MHVRTCVPAAILAAMPLAVANPYILAATAPAVANPYLNATTGTAADAGGSEAAQRVRGHFLPRRCTDAELRAENPQMQRLTDANRRLCSVYGNTIHQNDGTHLDGGIGIAEDAKWQRLHLRIAACNLPDAKRYVALVKEAEEATLNYTLTGIGETVCHFPNDRAPT
jgi:hypothetical protein